MISDGFDALFERLDTLVPEPPTNTSKKPGSFKGTYK